MHDRVYPPSPQSSDPVIKPKPKPKKKRKKLWVYKPRNIIIRPDFYAYEDPSVLTPRQQILWHRRKKEDEDKALKIANDLCEKSKTDKLKPKCQKNTKKKIENLDFENDDDFTKDQIKKKSGCKINKDLEIKNSDVEIQEKVENLESVNNGPTMDELDTVTNNLRNPDNNEGNDGNLLTNVLSKVDNCTDKTNIFLNVNDVLFILDTAEEFLVPEIPLDDSLLNSKTDSNPFNIRINFDNNVSNICNSDEIKIENRELGETCLPENMVSCPKESQNKIKMAISGYKMKQTIAERLASNIRLKNIEAGNTKKQKLDCDVIRVDYIIDEDSKVETCNYEARIQYCLYTVQDIYDGLRKHNCEIKDKLIIEARKLRNLNQLSDFSMNITNRYIEWIKNINCNC